MFIKLCVSIVIVFYLSNSLFVHSQRVVWDNLIDLCYGPRPERVLNRCEGDENIKFERRLYRNSIPYYCLVINNKGGAYNSLVIEYNGEKEFRKQHNYFAKAVPTDSLNEDSFELQNNIVRIVIYPLNKKHLLQRVIQIKLNNSTQCDTTRSIHFDPVYPNQLNNNNRRLLNSCFDIKSRAERERNKCELLDEVIVEEMKFNNELKYFCVMVDKSLRKNENSSENELIEIQLSTNKAQTLFSPTIDSQYNKNETNSFRYIFIREQMFIALVPKGEYDYIGNITSIRVNGVESCSGFVVKPLKQCGQIKIKYQPLVSFGLPTYPGEFPWHVRIFEYDPLRSRYLCGGSIIGHKTILTAAQCVDTFQGLVNKERLRVTVGSHDLSISESNSQEFRVQRYVIHGSWNQPQYSNDIAVIKLQTCLVYSDYIQPICFTRDKQIFNDKGGSVVGWGYNNKVELSEVLKRTPMRKISNSECTNSDYELYGREINDATFCAEKYQNGTNPCEGDVGGGLVFNFNDGWYIRGIKSVPNRYVNALERKQCDNQQFAVFTDVSEFYDWIELQLADENTYDANEVESYNKNETNNACFLNSCIDIVSRAQRVRNECELLDEVIVEELKVNNETSYYCVVFDKSLRKHGNSNESEIIEVSLSTNNTRVAVYPKANYKDPESTENYFRYSFIRGNMRIGIFPKNLNDTFGKITSIKVNGVESCSEYVAKPLKQCGKVQIKHQPLVSFGQTSYPGEFPWHVRIFEYFPTLTRYLCGGSIIGHKTILTAANCLYRYRWSASPENLRVIAGNHDRSISESISQDFRVQDYITHENWKMAGDLVDIAVIKLQTCLVYSDYIQPICFTPDKQIFNDKGGSVVGWGYDENAELSEVLKRTSMRIMPNSECRNRDYELFDRVINGSTFCVEGYQNGTNPCEGDVGGGLVFNFNDVWYIRGIKSTNMFINYEQPERCNSLPFAVFTDVSDFYDWIELQLADENTYDAREVESYNNNETDNACFLNSCFDIVSRAQRVRNECELLDEVIIEELKFNNETSYYCVVFDKNLRKSGYSNESEVIEVSLSTNNTRVAFYPKVNYKDPESTENYFRYSFIRGNMRIGIFPKNLNDTFGKITSIKVNGVESCSKPIVAKPLKQCGQVQINYQPLISFGNDTYPGQFPWHAGLFEIEQQSTRYFCGGSIIGPNTILTAAHCLDRNHGKIIEDIIRVQVGLHDLTLSDPNTREFRVRRYVIHKDWYKPGLANDIAVLKLRTYMVYSDYIQPICFMRDKLKFIDKVGTVVGWGINEHRVQKAILQRAPMRITSNDYCRSSNRSIFDSLINESTFCAGYRNGTSACRGDSGGGLVFNFIDGWYIRGIVSLSTVVVDEHQEKRCDSLQYVVFTDVSEYYDWLQDQLA